MSALTDIIGSIPYRMALAGGWIDQPFVSMLNPSPPGSIVVVGLEPTCRFMERAGMATGTRRVALDLWGDRLPDRDPAELVRELYREENHGRSDPSGSQDMIGLIYPAINRLDYDYSCEGGVFPRHIETCNDARVLAWLEEVIHVLPIAERPEGYNPLETKNLDPEWIRRLGAAGKECFDAILARNAMALGASMNACMACWEAILACTVRHPALTVDLKSLLVYYQSRYCGAMYSGCGGGYLFVVANDPVPGALKVRVRRR
jgi:hypothetical protein